MSREDLVQVGQRYGRLVITAVLARGQDNRRRVQARCECGAVKIVRPQNLIRMQAPTKSCGCFNRDNQRALFRRNRTHGEADRTVEYSTWMGMRARCLNPNAVSYPRYGGRGIQVDPAWRTSYATFLRDVGRRPGPGYSLDRIDNNGHYAPGNCRWATRSEQTRNSRRRRGYRAGFIAGFVLAMACREGRAA